MRRITYILSLFCLFSIDAQNYPGGVTGAEVWYMGDWEDIENGEFANSAQTNIRITKCGEADKGLFNFNASITSEKLCLEYMASLENTTGRNVFFVGKAKPEYSFSHLGTLWREGIGSFVLTDSIIRNFFDFNNKNLFGKDIYADYTSNKNANVNFYHSNHYNIDKKFKSYGLKGETVFYIGKITNPDEGYEDLDFAGNFPEFISFPKELSANERNRVDSYLALKYGLTLARKVLYRNSRNTVFWESSKNRLFHARVFGMGKDDVSGLNQLQSESTHLKEHLVAAVGDIMETNMEKQERDHIPNDHFIVFGDNGGKPDLIKENGHSIKFWEKVWLAQRTGKDVHKFPIHFKLFLTDELVDYMQSIPEESIWLLQDKHIGNDEISEFDSENIEYYGGEIDWENKTAYFKDVFFDSDLSVYDQFTFGVGPQMIVQAQVQGCKKDKLEVVLDITGGKAPYDILIEWSQGTINATANEPSYTFGAEDGVTYNVTVEDANGLIVEVEVTTDTWGFDLDLGPTQYLSASQPEIILNAGQGIPDPDATYQWYLDGVLLPFTGSSLTVNEPGKYKVVVTSGDLACTVEDNITILYKAFEVSLSHIDGCDQLHNALTLTIDGGFPNFTTSLEGINGTINYAHSGTTTITDIPYGSYIVTVTDSTGEIFEDTVDFFAPPAFELDLASQLDAICSACLEYPGDPGYPGYLGYDFPFFSHGDLEFTIDASVLIPSPTAIYKWFLNDVLISEQPTLTFDLENPHYCYQDPPYNEFSIKILRVEVSDSAESNCFASESFLFKGNCPNNDFEDTQSIKSDTESTNHVSLRTNVYPNPSEPSTTFTYEATATEQFDATVEVFTVTGAKLYSVKVEGGSNYTIPFSLNSAGMYLIRTSSSLGVKIDKVIIK